MGQYILLQNHEKVLKGCQSYQYTKLCAIALFKLSLDINCSQLKHSFYLIGYLISEKNHLLKQVVKIIKHNINDN